ncbi:hypothetical protein OKW28_003125 [Paraburkholderia sp. 40]
MSADHRDRVVELDDLAYAGDRLRMRIVDARERAAEHRTVRDRRVNHVGQAHVEAELRGTVDFLRRIETLRRRADQLEVLRVFQRHVLRRGQRGGGLRELTIARAAITGRVDHLTGLRMTTRRIDLPLLRGRVDQHHARSRARAAHRLPREADRRRAAGQLAAEQRVHEELFVGRRVIERDRAERHFEFLGDQHRNRRIDALAHLDLRYHERYLAGVVDLDERVRREHAALRRLVRIAADHALARLLILARGRHAEAEQQTAAGRGADRHAEFEEAAPRDAACMPRVGVSRLRAVLCIEQPLGHVRPPSRRA